MITKNRNAAKPFLKWAGGKTQLLEYIDGVLPKLFEKSNYFSSRSFVGALSPNLFFSARQMVPKTIHEL